MSTTLTNGLKLPDKGNVDWYADMQSNYTILDGAVGTIAEHTSALSEKAPLVHTHTKSDITDFPAYGNAAGTICEGNDSRLSDARTPVAHTHVTADVTDFPDMTLYPYKLAYTTNGGNFPYINLADSDHIALGFNGITDTGIYKVRATADVPGTPNVLTLDGILVVFNSDGTANVSSHRRCQQIFYQNSTTPKIFKRIGVFNITSQTWNWDTYKWVEYANTGRDFIPNETNSLNLGSSSYQWNNLYAKNYYYNGVAWGLDKSNTWTGSNTFTSITTKTNVDRTVAPTSDTNYGTITCRDKNGSAMFRMQGTIKTDLSNVWDMMLVAPNSTYQTFFKYTINSATLTKELRLKADSVIPDVSSQDLGTSNYKWKTLNGINPGALSLPDLNTAQTIDRTGWAYDGSTYNSIKLSSTDTNMTKNGWLYVRISSTGSSDKLSIKYNSIGDKYPTSSFGDTGGCIEVFVPVIAGSSVYLCATKDLQFCKFYPCLGNV